MLRCVCSRCRPKTMTLKQAIKALHWQEQVKRYGQAGALERREAQAARLRELRKRGE